MKFGICVSKGIAIGKAFLYEEPNKKNFTEHSGDSEKEQTRLRTAVEQSKADLENAAQKARETIGAHEAEILESQITLLKDPEIIENAAKAIEAEQFTAEKAVDSVTSKVAKLFSQMEEDEYMRERAADVKDVGNRLIAALLGRPRNNINNIHDNSILIAHDLKPSDTAQLDKQKVLGFITEIGGRTSHTAILARAMGIAAMVGFTNIFSIVHNGDTIILDSIAGEVIVNPDDETLAHYKELKVNLQQNKECLNRFRNIEIKDRNGRKITVAANIGSVADVQTALENGADAIGLFRTEFLFMDRSDMPSEDEQFEVYKEVAIKMGDKPVVIRTLDIGGDKTLPYLTMPKESNPFLGLRAIRLCLRHRDIFKVQLRALLRASAFGNIKIMFPMISCLQELDDAKAVLQECREELNANFIAFNGKLETGMMIEIPATAIMAEEFAKHVQFFSIGTNDLTQYTLAVDRMNETISDLYNSSHPAILALIRNTIEAAHKFAIPCHMCGEMAAEPGIIPTLFKYGLDEFSVSPSSILEVKEHIFEIVQPQ